MAGSDPAEGEQLLRDVLRQALDGEDYRLASAAAGDLANLLADPEVFEASRAGAEALVRDHLARHQTATTGAGGSGAAA